MAVPCYNNARTVGPKPASCGRAVRAGSVFEPTDVGTRRTGEGMRREVRRRGFTRGGRPDHAGTGECAGLWQRAVHPAAL